jgi:hypothetical protein
MDYSDITQATFKTTRTSNPLCPTYMARDDTGNVVEIGDVEGSRPKGLPPQRKDTKDGSPNLRTNDIAGATAGSKGKGVFA